MKAAVILYHKNIFSIYRERWIMACLESIRNQTVQEYDVLELCYSDEPQQLWPGSIFEHRTMPNHIAAMNHLLDQAFAGDYDIVFNTNLDDIYAPHRFESQVRAVRAGALLVSSDFQLMADSDFVAPQHMTRTGQKGEDILYQHMIFHNRNMGTEFRRGHNIVCHPCVAYTRQFWDKYGPYDVNRLGDEDFQMWKRVLAGGDRITILPELLCYYRISEKQTGRLHRRKPTP